MPWHSPARFIDSPDPRSLECRSSPSRYVVGLQAPDAAAWLAPRGGARVAGSAGPERVRGPRDSDGGRARLRRETGVRVTVTHLVARGIALALRQFPHLNGVVARGRIMLRDTVDIFLQVATDGGGDLSGFKIARADEKSVL